MYTVTVCRKGRSSKPNWSFKGQFFRTFYTLSELANFIHSNSSVFYFPLIKEELKSKEFQLLCSKLRSLYN